MTAIVRASGDKIAAPIAAIKRAGSDIRITIFLVMNKTMNDNRKNFKDRQIHHYITGRTRNNATND